MIFGHFSKVVALLLMHILAYFVFIDLWAFSKGISLAFDAHFGIFFIYSVFGYFPKGLVLPLMHVLPYFVYNDFWAFAKGVSLAFDAYCAIFFRSRVLGISQRC